MLERKIATHATFTQAKTPEKKRTIKSGETQAQNIGSTHDLTCVVENTQSNKATKVNTTTNL
jgi:hypothetical protein